MFDRRSVINPAIIVTSVQRTRSTNSYHYGRGGGGGGGFTIIIINDAANESCRLNNSCATHDLPVPLSLPLVFFFFPLLFPPLFPLLFGEFRERKREKARRTNERGAPRHRGIVTVRIVINQPCARINRDVTTLFCRSSAFPLALSSPSTVFLVSPILFPTNNNDIS